MEEYDPFYTLDAPKNTPQSSRNLVFGSQADRIETVQPKHVMLQVFAGSRAPLLIRHPGSLPVLRRRLARLLALSEATLRISAEVSAPDSKLAPRPDRPRLMRIRVSGLPIVGGVQMLMVLLSWLNLAAATLFCYFSLWVVAAPAPYVYVAPLPLLALFAHARYAFVALHAEFLVNAPLREVLGRRAAESTQLMLLALLGPDTVLLFSGIAFHSRGVRLSAECEATLSHAAAFVTPLLLDMPLLAVNGLLHKRTDTAWDGPAMIALLLGLFSVLVHWPYRLLHILRVRRRQQAARREEASRDLAVGEGEELQWDYVSRTEMAATMRQAESGFSRAMSPERERNNKKSEAQLKMLDDRLERADEAFEEAQRRFRAASPELVPPGEDAADLEAPPRKAYDA